MTHILFLSESQIIGGSSVMASQRRLIVGISGASGIDLGVRLLELLSKTDVETHLILSKAADLTRSLESSHTSESIRNLAKVVHPVGDVAASISSGSFRTMGMIIAPCSVKTLAEVATGVTSSLMSRAADVVLKERRRLVLMVRESPLNLIHLRNMTTATEAGAIIMPPVPAYYTGTTTVDGMLTQTAARALDLFDIEIDDLKRWGESDS
jgi:4-hydroxy-3-polyprenylbenzoate decarboxylase